MTHLVLLFAEALFGALPRTTRGQPLIISGKDDKKNMIYCHGNSVFIRNLDVSYMVLAAHETFFTEKNVFVAKFKASLSCRPMVCIGCQVYGLSIALMK